MKIQPSRFNRLLYGTCSLANAIAVFVSFLFRSVLPAHVYINDLVHVTHFVLTHFTATLVLIIIY